MRSNLSGILSRGVFLLAIVGMACGWVMPTLACPCSNRKNSAPHHRAIVKVSVASCQSCQEANSCCCGNPIGDSESEQIQELKCQCLMFPDNIPTDPSAPANPGSHWKGKTSQESNTALPRAMTVEGSLPAKPICLSWNDPGSPIPIRFCRLTI